MPHAFFACRSLVALGALAFAACGGDVLMLVDDARTTTTSVADVGTTTAITIASALTVVIPTSTYVPTTTIEVTSDAGCGGPPADATCTVDEIGDQCGICCGGWDYFICRNGQWQHGAGCLCQ